jgi:hypothetical protein
MPKLVQSVVARGSGTLTFAKSVGVGSFLILVASNDHSPNNITAVTGGGAKWRRAISAEGGPGNGSNDIWYGERSTGGTAIEVTVSAVATEEIYVSEWTGVGILRGAAKNENQIGPRATTPLLPAEEDDLVLVVMSSGFGSEETYANGFTQLSAEFTSLAKKYSDAAILLDAEPGLTGTTIGNSSSGAYGTAIAVFAPGIFGPRLIARLEPWMTPDLERLALALGRMFDPILELAEESGADGEPSYVPAWGILLEAERATLRELPYLGQYVGVEVPKGATEAEARTLVKAESGLARGTLRSLEEAIKGVLGRAPFRIEERTNPKTSEEEAYWLTIVVQKGKASNALYEAVNGVIPAGILYEILQVENAWIEGEKTWEEVKAGLKWSTPPKESEY